MVAAAVVVGKYHVASDNPVEELMVRLGIDQTRLPTAEEE